MTRTGSGSGPRQDGCTCGELVPEHLPDCPVVPFAAALPSPETTPAPDAGDLDVIWRGPQTEAGRGLLDIIERGSVPVQGAWGPAIAMAEQEARRAALLSPEATPAGVLATTTDLEVSAGLLDVMAELGVESIGPTRRNLARWMAARLRAATSARVLDEAALREALDGLWNAYSHYAGAAEGAGSFQSRAVQRLVEAAYEVIVADKGHPGRLGRAVDVSGILAASETTPAGVLADAALAAVLHEMGVLWAREDHRRLDCHGPSDHIDSGTVPRLLEALAARGYSLSSQPAPDAGPAIDREKLARAICWSREPQPAYGFVDDECRAEAHRLAAEYNRLAALPQPGEPTE